MPSNEFITTPEGRHRDATVPSTSVDGKDNPLLPRGRYSYLRRGSASVNTALGHRKGFLGALISGIGSNISLPSYVSQDQEFLSGHFPRGKLTVPVLTNQTRANRTDLLQLTSVNSGCLLLDKSDTVKNKMPDKSKMKDSDLACIVSTLYAKLLIVIGIAVPVTANVNEHVPAALDQGFYLYLYLVSVTFVITMYTIVLRDKGVARLTLNHEQNEQVLTDKNSETLRHIGAQHYGSFCLRLGAVGFGAGSLVFTGLQIGAEIASGPFRAITPGARLFLTMAQMHFIFLNNKNLILARYNVLAKIGLMHMIATNLCEWLQALVEETQNEIDQLGHTHEDEVGLMKSLFRNASPFLFPCTIEFSLICAVILFEMWKRVDERIDPRADNPARSSYHLTVDCSSSHRGLFGGVLLIAATILSLIMFFVLKEAKLKIAIEQVTALDAGILILGTITSIAGISKLRTLQRELIKSSCLDATLLAVAQAGLYLFYLFSVAGDLLTMGPTWILSLLTDVSALTQSTIQTLLIRIAWGRRRNGSDKPGKELVTFLIVVNIALWTVNTLEKSRAGVRPDHLGFFGIRAWTIITHISMPLAIFYRFHSAICLFEIWKTCYKQRPGIDV